MFIIPVQHPSWGDQTSTNFYDYLLTIFRTTLHTFRSSPHHPKPQDAQLSVGT